jgi:glutamate synthase domain-containing protein 2
MGVAALLALGCNRPSYPGPDGGLVDVAADYAALSTSPGHCAHCHTGRCPVGITTQDSQLESRLDLRHGAESVANFLRATTMEVTALARACGKSDVHHLEPEDLAALTIEAAAMAKVPLAGTGWIPGWPQG